MLDVTDEEGRKNVINRVLRESGRLDVLVNNAGVLCPGKFICGRIKERKPNALIGPIMDVDLDAARNAFETNYLGPMRLAQLVIPHMAEKGGGIVVNIGSVAGNM